jgi:hypothetical protein
MGMISIEFHANEPGIWFLHCHNLYHMKMGMARLVKYENFKRPDELKQDEKKWKRYMSHDNSAFYSSELGIHSNASEIEVKMTKGKYQVDINFEIEKYDPDHIEAEVLFKKYINKFLNYYTGFEYDDQRVHAVLGMSYTVPFRVEVETHVRTDGKLILTLSKSFPIAKNLSLDLSGRGEFGIKKNPGWEFESGAYYQVGNRTKVGVNYRWDKEIGHSVGVGVKVNINKKKRKKKPRNP